MPDRCRDDDGLILIADDFARLDDRFEQIARPKPAGDDGEVGAEAAAFVVEAMAGETLGFAEEIAAMVEIALGQAFLHDRQQFLDGPFLDERTRLDAELRRGRLGNRGQDRA